MTIQTISKTGQKNYRFGEWATTNDYKRGDVVIYLGEIYSANSDIPANTSFIEGTIGTTWLKLVQGGNTSSTLGEGMPGNVSVDANGVVTISAGGVANVLVVDANGVSITSNLSLAGPESLIIPGSPGAGSVMVTNADGVLEWGTLADAVGNSIAVDGLTTTGNITTTGIITSNTVTVGETLTVTGEVTTESTITAAGNITSSATVAGESLVSNTTITAEGNITSNATIAGNAGEFGTLTITDGANLGDIANLTILGGNAGEFLQTDGNGVLTWANAGANGNSGVTTNESNVTMNVEGNTVQIIDANGTITTGDSTVSGNITAGETIQGNVVIANVTETTDMTVSGIANLGNVENVFIYGGAPGQVLTTDGTGNLVWASGSANGDSGVTTNTDSVTLIVEGNTIQTIDANGTSTTGNANITGDTNVTGNVVGGNIISNGSITSQTLMVETTIIADGNIMSNGTIIGDAIQSNTANFAGNVIAGNITSNGSVTADSFIGEGTALANITGANVTGVVANANYAAYAGNVTIADQPNITSVGTLTSLSIAGDIIPAADEVYDLGNATHKFRDLWLSGSTLRLGNLSMSAVSNSLSVSSITANTITANLYTGNGAALTNINGANVTGITANANFSAYSGNVTVSAQPNITSVGTLTELTVSGLTTLGDNGNIKITGGSTGQVLTTDGAGNLTWTSGATTGGSGVVPSDTNVTVEVANTVIQTIDANGTTTTGNANVTGDITAGGTITSNTVVANTVNTTGNITGGNITSNGTIDATGNITGGNITSNGAITSNTLTTTTTNTANLNVTGAANLGSAANLTITGGTLGQSLISYGNGAVTWDVANGIQHGNSTVEIAANGFFFANIQGNTVMTVDQAGMTFDGTLLVQNGRLRSMGNLEVNGTSTLTGAVSYNQLGTTNVNATVGLPAANRVSIPGGTPGQILATSGNLAGNLYWANVSDLISASPGGTVNTATVISETITTETITSDTANVSGNVIAGNVIAGNITSNSTIIANTFTGNATGLSNIPGANVIGLVANANYAAYAGNVTIAAQPNITSVGTLTALSVAGNLGVTGNLNLDGDLNIIGNLNYANVGQLVVTDPIIYIADGNPGDVLDMGLVGETDGGTYNGIVRDENTDTWRVFKDLATRPTTTVDWANTTAGNFSAGNTSVTKLTVGGQSLLGAVGNVKVTGGANGQVLRTDGTGNLSWGTLTAVSAAEQANYANFAGLVTISAQSNITQLGTLLGITVAGVSNLGPVGNVRIAGGFSGQSLVTDGLGNLSWSSSGIAENANISNVANFANFAGNITVAAQPNITSLGILTSLSASGNITGANITGTHYGAGNNLSNIQGANVSGAVAFATTANSVAGANVVGNVTSAITANFANFAGNITVAAQPNITSIGTLSSLTVSGNVTGGNLTTTGNVSTANLTATANVSLGFVSNVRMTGGTSGQFLQTDGTGTLSWATVSLGAASNISNGTSNVGIDTLNGNVAIKVNGTTNIAVFSTAGANITGTANVSGNLSAGRITSASSVIATGIVQGSSLTSLGTINAVGDITGANITGTHFGPGGNLSNIQGANVSGAVAFATTANAVAGANVSGNVTSAVTANFANFAGNVTVAAQPNITSVGTLTGLTLAGVANLGAVGNVKITGGSTGQYLKTDGSGTLSWSAVATVTSLENGQSNIVLAYANSPITMRVSGQVAGYIGDNVTGRTSIGYRAAELNQGASATAFGALAGALNQGQSTVAIGNGAGYTGQLAGAVAVGDRAGNAVQGAGAIAIGKMAGRTNQGESAISIGLDSANTQGTGAIAIGANAAANGQAANSIVLNATGTALTAGTANALFVKPVRAATGSDVVFYNSTSGEMTYGALPTASANFANFAGNVTIAAQPNITSVGTLTALTVSGVANIGNVANVKIAGGTTGQVLSTDGAGNLSWATSSAGGVQDRIADPGFPNAANVVVSLANLRIALQSAVVTDISQTTFRSGVGSIVGMNGIAIGYWAGSGASHSINMGYQAGNLFQGANAVAIGASAGKLGQGDNAIAIGRRSSENGQGAGSIAIGAISGWQNSGAISIGANSVADAQATNSIVLNATGLSITASTANALYIAPIRNATAANVVYYDPVTKEITYSLSTGGASLSQIDNGTSNVVVASSGNVSVGIAGAANILVVSSTGANINGTANITSLSVTGTSNLGPAANVIITGGTAGQTLTTNGSNVLSWASIPAPTSIINGNSGIVVDANSWVRIGSTGTANVVTIGSLGLGVKGVLSVQQGPTSLGSINEGFITMTGATGVVPHSAAVSQIYYHTGMTANFTPNLLSMSVTSFGATVVTFVLTQGVTAYIPNALQIAGVAQTIRWQGGVVPTGNANKLDVVAFTIICTAASTYIVTGQLVSYG